VSLLRLERDLLIGASLCCLEHKGLMSFTSKRKIRSHHQKEESMEGLAIETIILGRVTFISAYGDALGSAELLAQIHPLVGQPTNVTIDGPSITEPQVATMLGQLLIAAYISREIIEVKARPVAGHPHRLLGVKLSRFFAQA
jgi:hypothetical protein